MDNIRITFPFLLVLLLEVFIVCAKRDTTDVPTSRANPLATVILDKNVIENVNNSNRLADEVLSRVRRQLYGYDPYYRRRYPPIIFGGGGFGRGFGGRGFGGRGFGGRGFGGRGFGGRGIGGRGIGGRGIGGRGGGGGHGGRG